MDTLVWYNINHKELLILDLNETYISSYCNQLHSSHVRAHHGRKKGKEGNNMNQISFIFVENDISPEVGLAFFLSFFFFFVFCMTRNKEVLYTYQEGGDIWEKLTDQRRDYPENFVPHPPQSCVLSWVISDNSFFFLLMMLNK